MTSTTITLEIPETLLTGDNGLSSDIAAGAIEAHTAAHKKANRIADGLAKLRGSEGDFWFSLPRVKEEVTLAGADDWSVVDELHMLGKIPGKTAMSRAGIHLVTFAGVSFVEGTRFKTDGVSLDREMDQGCFVALPYQSAEFKFVADALDFMEMTAVEEGIIEPASR